MSTCASADDNAEKAIGNLIGGVNRPYLESGDWGWQD